MAGRVAFAVSLVLVLGAIAWLSPAPNRVTDRGVYEATAAQIIVPDCTDLHCFRVLVPWVLGRLPGSPDVTWKAYAVLANAGASLAVLAVCGAWGFTRREAWIAAALSAFGFGSLFTLHDPFTADPLMYALAPVVVVLLVRERVAVAAVVAAVGVLAKEFVAAPLYIFAAAAAIERRPAVAARALAAANLAFIVWLVLQLTLMLRFNYGYGDNPSTHLLSGGFLAKWIADQSPRGVAVALFNEYGALYLLAPAGLWLAPAPLRRFALVSVPVAALFAYVQQPDRALWNFHFIATPLAALMLARVPAALAWSVVGTFAFANLRVGAQLPDVPAARFAMGLSVLLALAAVVMAWRAAPESPAGPWSGEAAVA